MAYQMRNVMCGAAAGLEPEREAFHTAISACTGAEAMARGILYVPLSLPAATRNKAHYQDAVDYNIRLSMFYVLVLADTWGPPIRNFEQDYRLAIQCRDDPGLPMKEVVVFLKKLPPGREPEPAVVELRQQLSAGAGPRHFSFTDTAEFEARLRALLSEWLPVAAARAESATLPAERPMTSDDDLFVHDLIIHAASDELGAAAWPAPVREQLLEIQYKARLRGIADNFPGATHEILLHGAARAGWAVMAQTENEIRLVDVIVAHEYRGRGIATARIRQLLAESDRTGKPVRLSVAMTNRALGLYQRLGFQPTGADEVRCFLERPPAESASS